jgi:hypothetical protein
MVGTRTVFSPAPRQWLTAYLRSLIAVTVFILADIQNIPGLDVTGALPAIAVRSICDHLYDEV